MRKDLRESLHHKRIHRVWAFGFCVILAGAGALSCLSCNGTKPPDPQGPNVLLVTVDTLRADHVGAYGASQSETPVMDELAANGVRFANAYSVAPITLPSHASILTGLYPTRHGVRHNGIFRLGGEAETVAERLDTAGYETGAVVGAFVLDARFGLDQGFDFYDDEMSRFAATDGYAERSAREVTDSAISWLKENRSKPFFLWVHYYDPHSQYQPPPEFAERFVEHPYAGEVAFADAELGRLLASLESQGHDSETFVIVTSDHGESLGEHGEETHSYTLYDASLAVPLIMRGPEVPAGKVIDEVVSIVDITPTILSATGLDPKAGLDGLDLAPFWTQASSQSLPTRSATYAETLATQLTHGWAPLYAMRSQTHLYVQAPRSELYDVRSDPAQTSNLLEGSPSEEATRLARALGEELQKISHAEVETGRDATVDGETLRQLEKLGYAMPAGPVVESGLDPKDGLRWLNLLDEAKVVFQAGEHSKANAMAEEVLKNLPNSPDALVFKAQVDVKARRFHDALRYAEKSEVLSPHSTLNRVLVGFIRKELGDLKGAAASFRSIEEEGIADEPLAEVGIMWVYAAEGDSDSAESHAEKALGFVHSESTLLEIGKVWESVGEYERALDAYRNTLSEFPESEETQMLLAIQMARLGNEDATREHLEKAGAAANNPVHMNRLAIVYAATGQFEEAERIFLAIIQLYPDYPSAQKNLETLRKQMR